MRVCATQVTLKPTKLAPRPCKLALLLSLALVTCGAACLAQSQETGTSPAPNTDTTPPTSTAPPTPPSRPQFFAGTVIAIDDQQITVSRTLVGHQPDTRTFHLTPKTKLNRNSCKINTKVTVRYQRLADASVALQVLVHPQSKSPARHP